MPERPANVDYTPYPTTPASGGGGTPMSVHATPEDFGSQVAGAVKQAGDKGFDVAQKQQGMINETNAVNAETALSDKLGSLHGEYMALSGQQAYEKLPQYKAAATAAVQETRGTLQGAEAIHMYDMLAQRRLSGITQDWEGHSAMQIKQANENAQLSGLHAATLRAGDTNVAMSDQLFGEEVTGPIKYHATAALDENQPGFKTDPETGNVSFSDDAIGKNAKANFDNNLNHYLGQAYIQRYDTLADTLGPHAAEAKFQQDKARIPPDAQAVIASNLEPRLFHANVSTVVNTTMGEAQQAHRQLLVNPSSAGSNAYNLGNVKTAEGAASNTQDFVQPATPVDGVILTANNLRSKNYEGKTLQQIGETWTSTDKSAWVKNVSAVSGISPDTVPNLNDPKQLSSLMKGIAVAEKSPADRAHFTDDVISQGVTASLSGQKPNTAQPKAYATNDMGGRLTDADYYQTHRAEVIQGARDWAEKTDPGNLRLSQAAVERVNQEMEKSIQDQNGKLSQYKNIIQRAANGDLTQGKKPMTMDDMMAIPGVKDAIDSVSVHDSSDFMRRLDERLAARGTGKEDKTLGTGYMDVLKGIHPTDGSVPTITNDNQIYDAYYAGKITDAGRAKLISEFTSAKKDPAGAAIISAKTGAWEGLHKQISFQDTSNKQTPVFDPVGEAKWSNAIPLLEKQLDDNREKKIPDYKSFDPSDNDYVGNAIKPLLRTPAQRMQDQREASLIAGGMHHGDDYATVHPLIYNISQGKIKGDEIIQQIKYMYKAGKMSRETATDLLVKNNLAQVSQNTESSEQAIVPRPE